METSLWNKLTPGTVFRFDNKLYLKMQGDNILALEDFAQVGLHGDVTVEKIGNIKVSTPDETGMVTGICFNSFETTLEDLLDYVNRIVNNPELDWEQKYDFVFSDKVSKRVFKEFPLEYYDPDTSYQEDVMAWVSAFRDAMAERRRQQQYQHEGKAR